MYFSGLKRFWGAILVVLGLGLNAQVAAPSLRCIACNAGGDLTLTWVIPSDPGNQFFQYDIYYSAAASGPFTLQGSVATYSVNTYTHVGAGGNLQSKYYFLKTRWGAGGTNTSSPSDTLKSIFLNLSNSGNGIGAMTYNQLHTPNIPSSSGIFNVNREHPANVWSNIKNTSSLFYNDTISICTVTYTYQVLQTDASGCASSSNLPFGTFNDRTRPNDPAMDSVSVDATGLSHLGWQPSSSSDCIGYVVYQYSGAWIPIDTVFGINNTAFTSTSAVASGTTVNYCVASIDSCKNISQLSTNFTTIYLKTKYNVCARTVDLQFTTYINMPSGVLQYNIYRSVNGGNYLLLGNTPTNFFTDTGLIPGNNYSYFARAVSNSHTITSSSNLSSFIASAPPTPSFAYLKAASVDFSYNVGVSIYADTTKPCLGFNISRSEDGITFNHLAFVPYAAISRYLYVDTDVSTKEKNYFYKVDVLDSCSNIRYTTNTAKTILLKVKNDGQQIFTNNLSWNDYSTWLGGVAGYYIYRVVNEMADPAPINFVPYGTTTYTDNVEDIVAESGKVGYYVQAVEGFGNTYGITATANSNISEAYVEGQVFVPSAFAPKGRNRVWLPVAQFVEKSDYHVSVFNRWGSKVFETASDTEGWDGNSMEEGAYAYLIEYKNSRGEFIQLKGTVLLLR
ncbi:MAG: T9SS type B sorting domain-containing protein [Bacteroidia bacterium]